MSRLRVGVVGCGAIAQIQHLPHLRDGRDRFEIGGICDIAPDLLAEGSATTFTCRRHARFTDVHDLVDSDIDAVLICSSGSHAPQVLAAAAAGKHVLVEKPACVTIAEAQSMIDACDAAGVVLMVAYPKRYEQSYAYAASRVRAMDDVRLIQINHLHPSNDLHMAEFSFHRANLPVDVVARLRASGHRLGRGGAGPGFSGRPPGSRLSVVQRQPDSRHQRAARHVRPARGRPEHGDLARRRRSDDHAALPERHTRRAHLDRPARTSGPSKRPSPSTDARSV